MPECLFSVHSTQATVTCVKRPLSKRPKLGFQDQLLLNAGQKYCRMLQGKHSAILSTFIKLLFIIKIFVLSILEWPFYTGLTVQGNIGEEGPLVWLISLFYKVMYIMYITPGNQKFEPKLLIKH